MFDAEMLEVLRLQAVVIERLTAQLNGTRHATPPPRTRAHQPQNKELREWAPFVAYYQKLERAVRRDQHLRPDDEVTKTMIWTAGGPSPKTTTRIMVDTHGLLADQWPPSTWPTEPPTKGPSGQI
jgi:hypothetical protein